MSTIKDKRYDAERALYGSHELTLEHCVFDGPADGESALKESHHITAKDCMFNLRYPLWHDDVVKIDHSVFSKTCRAALWYSHDIEITDTKLHGIKALRECSGVKIRDCDIVSPEFGWSVHQVDMADSIAESEYFMMRSDALAFSGVSMKGKYSFQYIEDSVFERCTFDTKDAFWHAKHVVIRDSVIKGEYLAWYCEDVTFERCKIIGIQPLCYCKGLKLIDCEMLHTDLSFERSEVEATISTPVDSIKNPRSGYIDVPAVGEIIMDDAEAKGVVHIRQS